MNPKFAIGLMSGTSADGIDAALVRTDGDRNFDFVDFLSVPYEADFRKRLLGCAQVQLEEPEILAVELQLTDLHAAAVHELIVRNTAPVELVGFHGHTISHHPELGQTRQIGDGQRLAELCRVPVVYDFRSLDMREGGQGAPLVPLFHAMLFADQPQPCAIVNIGGVANVTWIDRDSMMAGDTGPGCGLLDDWIQSTIKEDFDVDGSLSKKGRIDEGVLDKLDNHSFFASSFPKSADRFDFDSISVDHLSPADGAATLCEVTARTVAEAIQRIGTPETTWITGGGAKNPVIMKRLSHYLRDVRPVEDAGLRADSLEAECFAWLAVRRLAELPTTLPSTTGCRRPVCGGTISC